MRIGGIYEADYPIQLLRTQLVLGENETSMTAIAIVFMPESFVIGADGLRQTTDKSKTIYDAQKIFKFQTEKITAAYGWCGHTVVWNEDNPEQVFFDFGAVTGPILTIASLLALDIDGFVENVRARLLAHLMQSNDMYTGWISAAKPGSVARMLVAGYFNLDPFSFAIDVNQINLLPSVTARRFNPSNDLRVFSGHPSTAEDESLKRVPVDVEDARNLVHEYIQKCIDNPECKDIGGRTHVAVVSPNSFDWIDAPEISS
jgi:hypothetical protein